MNSLEQLETETYSTIQQYRADVASPQYRELPAFREAIDRKLERSWETLKPQAASFGTGSKGTAYARRENGEVVIDHGFDPTKRDAPESAAIKNANTFTSLPGGALRFSK